MRVAFVVPGRSLGRASEAVPWLDTLGVMSIRRASASIEFADEGGRGSISWLAVLGEIGSLLCAWATAIVARRLGLYKNADR